MNREYLEYLHRSGKIPDKYYYQLNGGNAQENYNEQKKALVSRLIDGQREQQLLNEFIQEEVEKKLNEAIQNAMNDIFKNFTI